VSNPKPVEPPLTLNPMPGRYCVARLPGGAPVPAGFFDGPGFCSATQTGDELSLVYLEGRNFSTQKCEPGWTGFKVQGVLDFALVGILARLSGALADAGVSLFALSTHDTDYLFVKAEQEPAAREALAKVAVFSG
jgi:uncharacterized protein